MTEPTPPPRSCVRERHAFAAAEIAAIPRPSVAARKKTGLASPGTRGI